MKSLRNIKKCAFVAGLFALLLNSGGCTGDFEDINRNPNEVTEEEIQRENHRTGANMRMLMSHVVPTEEHRYQFLELLLGGSYGGYVESTKIWDGKFSTFNARAARTWHYIPFIDVLKDTYAGYRGVVNNTTDPVMIALAKILRVAIMQRMTDTYGPIPYSQVVDNNKTESLVVAYDSQQAVYEKMFEELNESIAALKENAAGVFVGFDKLDGVYQGRLDMWLKYANSLKLRLAMRLAYVDEGKAKLYATEAINEGLILTNSDNASFQLAENRGELCWNDWNDHRVAADIISVMNGYNDPRREAYFTRVVIDENDPSQTAFVGLRVGATPSDEKKAEKSYSNMKIGKTDPYVWFTASEVAFLKAEYELRWGSEATAQSLYEEGIRLSFEQRGVSGYAEYIAQEDAVPANHTDYLSSQNSIEAQSTIKIPWATETYTFEEHLEQIITQKWIAIFPLGNEAWAEYRRTGYPRLFPVAQNRNFSNGTVDSRYGARRLDYPDDEYTENAEHLTEAIGLLGGPDNQGTRLWWDVKPYK